MPKLTKDSPPEKVQEAMQALLEREGVLTCQEIYVKLYVARCPRAPVQEVAPFSSMELPDGFFDNLRLIGCLSSRETEEEWAAKNGHHPKWSCWRLS